MSCGETQCTRDEARYRGESTSFALCGKSRIYPWFDSGSTIAAFTELKYSKRQVSRIVFRVSSLIIQSRASLVRLVG